MHLAVEELIILRFCRKMPAGCSQMHHNASRYSCKEHSTPKLFTSVYHRSMPQNTLGIGKLKHAEQLQQTLQ